MPFSPKMNPSLIPGSRRRKSLAHGEESELGPSSSHHALAGLQPSASTSWINPFGRASFSVDDDAYHAPDSLPSSRRPSAATIISTLLHGVGMNTNAASSAVRLSHDEPGYSSSDAASSSGSSRPAQLAASPAPAQHTRRPSAIFKAWKARRGSAQGQNAAPPVVAPTAFASGRRKSSALTRVLQPVASGRRGSTANLGAPRIDEHRLSSTLSGDAGSERRRSLSIVCRGERDSDELTPSHRSHALEAAGMPSTNGVTAAMAIRDTWLYGSHQWTHDGRKGSISTQATSPSHSHFGAVGRKSLSGAAMRGALGLDEEDEQMRYHERNMREGDAASVVSLSLTEEIALYTSDVQAVEQNAGRARRSANSSTSNASMTQAHSKGASGESGRAAFVWNLPDWGAPSRVGRLPELSPAPALVIADPFAAIHAESSSMQRIESGSLDPVLSPVASSAVLTPVSEQGASHGHSDHTPTHTWSQPQWNLESPFRPDAPLASPSSHQRASVACTDQSPTSPNFTLPGADETPRRATTYFDASSLPIVDEVPGSPTEVRLSPRLPRSPRSPRTFGTSETSYEMSRARRRTSYSHPRPPAGYDVGAPGDADDALSETVPTPRLVSAELTSSPMSSNFAPETPSSAVRSFPADVHVSPPKEEGDDLHAQFCSVLLLDLGNGTAIPLSPSPGTERVDPFALLAH